MGGVNIHSQTKIDNTPVEDVTDRGISSGWAYDHITEADPHTQYRLESEDHDHSSTGLQGGNIPGTSVVLEKLGTSTYDDAQDFANSFGACGRKTGGVISDAGSSYIAVTAGTGFIKATDDDNATLMFFDWPAPSNIAIPANSTRYIGVEYNSGTPQVVSRTTDTWDLDTEFSLGVVVNDTLNSASVLHILNNPWWVTDGTTNMLERFRAEGHIVRDKYIGGLMLSVTGTRCVAVTAGTLWSNVNEFLISAIDTNVSGTVELYWYSSINGWQYSDITQYSVTQWNDITQPVLQTISNNKYCNIWVYIEADDKEITLLYPQAEYVSASLAAAASAPSTLPPHLLVNGILIGKIVIKQGEDIPIAVLSAFTNVFSTSVVSDHGNLAGLADDDHTQYLLVDGTRAMSGDLDFNLNEAHDMAIHNISSFINEPSSGKIILNTSDNGLYYCISEV